MTKKELDDSGYWYYIFPICVLILILFAMYILFTMPSIQMVETKKVFKLINKLSHKIK